MEKINKCHIDKEDQSSDPKHLILNMGGEKAEQLWTLSLAFLVATDLPLLPFSLV